MIYDVIIIGAGASGMMCASYLKAHDKNMNVLLLEKNDKIGKKVLITGNGKCNLGNVNLSKENYSNDFLLNIDLEYIKYLESIGIITKEENEKLYPYSMQASTICKMFERNLSKNKVEIKLNYLVKKIELKEEIYEINNEIKAKKIVIATGGKTYPKTGSTGDGYEFLKQLGHFITPLEPSLVNLKTNYKYIKDLAGVRFNAKVDLVNESKIIESEIGQVQFTKDSLSGICIFNLSRNNINYNSKVLIDLMPEYDENEIVKKLNKNYNVEESLSGLINNKLAIVIAKELKLYGRKMSELSNESLMNLATKIKKMEFQIIEKGSFEEAQVTKGGASLKEFSNALQSTKQKNLYAIGEVLDVDGKCGGFNLAWAFNSAILVAKDILG